MEEQKQGPTGTPVEPMVSLPEGDGEYTSGYQGDSVKIPAMDMLGSLMLYLGPAFSDLCMGAIRHADLSGRLQYDEGVDVGHLGAIGWVRDELAVDVRKGSLVWTTYQDRKSFRATQ